MSIPGGEAPKKELEVPLAAGGIARVKAIPRLRWSRTRTPSSRMRMLLRRVRREMDDGWGVLRSRVMVHRFN